MKTYECRFASALGDSGEVVVIQADDDLHAYAKADDLLIDEHRYASVDLYGAERCIARLKRELPVTG
jgi:hypothetical protein